MDDMPFNFIVNEAMPADQILIGDFTEIDRARQENRPINPNAFMLLKNVPAVSKDSTE
jgi:hypothetical protein